MHIKLFRRTVNDGIWTTFGFVCLSPLIGFMKFMKTNLASLASDIVGSALLLLVLPGVSMTCIGLLYHWLTPQHKLTPLQ